MRRYKIICLVTIVLLALSTIPAFPQEEQTQTPAPAEIVAPTTETSPKTEELSIYGEVKSVNQASNSLTIQYYDYDSDEEKTIEIGLDKDTKIENAAALNDIKENNYVDVTYSISSGKSIAKSIKVEKEEEVPAETAVPENAPLDTQEEE